MPDDVLGVIPARYASSRFPGKALAEIVGKPMIQHVFERASQCARLGQLVIATDDPRIAEAAARFGAPCEFTSPEHPTGTDRVVEVAVSRTAPLVVNIQGDEPLIDHQAITTAIEALEQAPACMMSTLCRKISSEDEVDNPNVVKVVRNLRNEAIYFSRFAIPYPRGIAAERMKHVGLYVYRRDFLLQYSGMPRGPLEQAESLEQLRALENGHRIAVAETGYDSIGVDTPEDLERIRAEIEARMYGNTEPTRTTGQV